MGYSLTDSVDRRALDTRGSSDSASPLLCAACGLAQAEVVLSLPPVPIHVGLLWKTAQAAQACPKGGMRLALCEHCGYVWNTEFNVSNTHYEQDYDNALHHSPSFAAWERELAESLVQRHSLYRRRVAEIGCGDGRFLSLLCLLGDNVGTGFEPGFNSERASELVSQANVHVLPEFADLDSLRRSDVDFVVARHLLEHIPEPTSLVDSMRDGVRRGGGVYVEVPNLSWTLRRRAFEDFMYEHCGYYTPQTLAHMLARRGFDGVVESSSFEGLFASVEAAVIDVAPDGRPISPGLVDELRTGLRGVRERIAEIDDTLTQLRQAGRRVVAWGGGARAVGLLNLVKASDAVEFVVDVNPRKQGTFVTGSGHPIVAPAALKVEPPDLVLVINPVYRDEIAGMLTSLGVFADLRTI